MYKNTFSAITQPHIIKLVTKTINKVLSLLIFYETRKKPKIFFKVLSCVIYKKLSEIMSALNI